MTVFSYKAVKHDGKRQQGVIEAVSLLDAKRLLREQQLIITFLEEKKAEKKENISFSFDDLVIFTSQLSQLLSANIPLYESLEALEEQAKGEKHQPMIGSLREQVRKGTAFSKALSLYPGTFSPLYRAIVVAGESVGSLDQSLLRLSQLLTTERTSRQKLISALLYPAVLLCLLVVAISLMVFFVIPSIEGLFEGKTLPGFTQVILGISHFFNRYALFLGISAVAIISWSAYKLSFSKVRQNLYAKMLSFPVIGQYLMKSSLARFARTLSSLLLGGTTLSSALGFSKEALEITVLEEEMEKALQMIIQGEKFSTSLKKSPHIPPLFSRMVALGEETGRLAPILANLSGLYEEDSERLLERAVSLLQPALLVFIGLIIGSTLLAVLLPLSNFGALMSM